LQLTGGIISSGTLGKGSAGNIFISSKDGVLIERGEITSFTKGQGNAGDISIISTDGSFFINNGGLVSITQAQGNGGNISIISNDTVVANNGIIDSSTFAQGNGGQISINSHSRVLIDKGSIGSITYAQGDAGNINIQTPTLIITNESFISTGTASPIENFPGGRGKGGNITFDTDYVLINKGGMISAGTQYFGDGGDIIINTRVLEAFSGGTISTNTISSGRGGNITINAADNLTLSDITDNGDRTAITAFASSIGDAGTISLSTSNFNISNGAGVFTNFHIKNGFIRASAEQSNGGNIKINAGNISLRNDSKIRTDLSSGNSRGGNISLSADTIIALEDSDILAFASEGQGGNITFNTRAVFSDSLYNPKQIAADKNSLQSLINNGHSDINATGSIAGNIIGVPDISFIQNSLIQLQNNPIDTNALIANSCIARSPNKEGTFMITGTGGLPHRPGEVAGSSYPTGDVQSVTNSSAASVWKKGDRIVEPQGVYKLANGDLVMSRECS
jgi:large exoprotein involved in heme utilization and adhesion